MSDEIFRNNSMSWMYSQSSINKYIWDIIKNDFKNFTISYHLNESFDINKINDYYFFISFDLLAFEIRDSNNLHKGHKSPNYSDVSKYKYIKKFFQCLKKLKQQKSKYNINFCVHTVHGTYGLAMKSFY